jgi:hypothetical protein
MFVYATQIEATAAMCQISDKLLGRSGIVTVGTHTIDDKQFAIKIGQKF